MATGELIGVAAQLALGMLALADVAQDSGVVALALDGPGGERELDRDLDFILAQGGDFERLADDPARTALTHPAQSLPVVIPEALRNDELKWLTDGLLGAPSEDALGGAI